MYIGEGHAQRIADGLLDFAGEPAVKSLGVVKGWQEHGTAVGGYLCQIVLERSQRDGWFVNGYLGQIYSARTHGVS